MAATSTIISPLPPPTILSSSKPRPPSSLLFHPPPGTSLSTLNLSTSPKPRFPSHHQSHSRNCRTLAAVEAAPPADLVSPLDAVQEIAAPDDGVGIVISTLLLIAFAVLSVLTIGVIYIAVTDFLQKREKDKFEKEEEARQKKRGSKGKKIRARSRAGPRGFGQKVVVEEDDESSSS